MVQESSLLASWLSGFSLCLTWGGREPGRDVGLQEWLMESSRYMSSA